MKHSKIILRQAQNDAERSRSIKTSDQIVKNQHFTILELLDRLLDKGVVVKGEILLSVADIDLVYLNLGLLLSSVKTIEEAARRRGNGETRLISWPACNAMRSIAGRQTSTQGEFLGEPRVEIGKKDLVSIDVEDLDNGKVIARALPSVRQLADHGMEQVFEPRANIDPKNVEKGLSKLVLTLVDLIRKLMEKQAVRKIEAGLLNAREIERMGNALLLLDEKMDQLKKTFGLKDEDLNLDLGPLGELI